MKKPLTFSINKFRELGTLMCFVIICLITFIGCSDETEKEKQYTIEQFSGGNDIIINYPQLIGEKYQELNQMIYEEALYVLKYYLPEELLKLQIDADITFFNNDYISIMYEGTGQLDNVSKVNQFKYTTNIDLNKNEKIRLSEIINIDDEFIEQFMTFA